MNSFHIYASFTKASVDVAKRTVTGVAQVEDAMPDTQGDVVTFEASKRAFAAWAGNIREMHGPKAVGKCVSWWADPVTKRIYVRARISEGAEDTWQKVLDGTLSGFSIGGQQIAAKRGINKTTGRPENRITAYRLNELSLVDSPANANCIITAIHKRNGHLETTGVFGQGAHNMSTKAASKVAVLAFTKSIAKPEEELVLIKRSDIEAGRTDGLAVLKKGASIVTIRKDDMGEMVGGDGEGMSDDKKDDKTDNIDLEDHATNMANAHRDLCKMAGIDDHVGHYEDATMGDDQGDMDDAGDGQQPDTGAEGADMQMGRGFGRRGGNLTKAAARRRARRGGASEADIQARIDKAVGNATAAMASKIDDLTKALGNGSQIQPRNAAASGEGTPIEKTVGDLLGNGDGLSKGSAGHYRALLEKKASLDTEIATTLAKMKSGHKLTPEEDIRRQALGREITRVEVELSDLASKAASV
jgi:hypothetical protein